MKKTHIAMIIAIAARCLVDVSSTICGVRMALGDNDNVSLLNGAKAG